VVGASLAIKLRLARLADERRGIRVSKGFIVEEELAPVVREVLAGD
jgi:hypothetical protein